MRKFLESKGWWSSEEEDSLKASQKKAVLTAFHTAEKDLKPSLTGLFTDVYSDEDTPWNLVNFFFPYWLAVLNIYFESDVFCDC
jgi:2-oxoisovalerate dehydrogenase E1 component alpha subunit